TVVFGDRIYTDIASGVAAGVDTGCVLSGEVTALDVEKSEIKPTYLLDKATDILSVL
ncbi:MAG: HAD hydrolase-like protein, partial [Clostridia bacterium]|nr:HAD hydrolase-like protein [Clostridia bacterium]